MKKQIVVFAILIIYSQLLLAAPKLNYKSIPSNSNNKISFYLFIEPTSCFTCLESINYYYNLVKKFNIQFTVFIKDINNSNIAEFKKEKNWNFNIIADPIGLYSSYYNIKLLPTFILINSKGNVKLKGKCGGVEISENDIVNEILKLKKNLTYKDIRIEHLKEIKRIQLTKSTKPITSTKKRFLLITKDKNYYLLANSQLAKYQLFDSTGNQINEIDLSTINIDPYFIFHPVWVDGDSVILGISMDERANRILYYLNIFTGEAELLNNNYFNNDSLGWNKGISFLYHNYKNGKILGYIFPLKSRKLTNQDTLFVITDRFGKKINQFYLKDELYWRNSISYIFAPSFDIIEPIGYIINISPSNKIFMTDFSGNLIKTIDINFDSTFKKGIYEENDLLKKKSVKELINMNLNSSTISSIKYDKVYNIINITHFNRVIPNDKKISEAGFSDINLQYYINSINLDGSNFRDYTIKFPINIVPFFIEGDIIIASEYYNNNLSIIWFKINGK